MSDADKDREIAQLRALIDFQRAYYDQIKASRRAEDRETRKAFARLKRELRAAKHHHAEAVRIINLGLELMTDEQVGQWEGIRAWLELNWMGEDDLCRREVPHE